MIRHRSLSSVEVFFCKVTVFALFKALKLTKNASMSLVGGKSPFVWNKFNMTSLWRSHFRGVFESTPLPCFDPVILLLDAGECSPVVGHLVSFCDSIVSKA